MVEEKKQEEREKKERKFTKVSSCQIVRLRRKRHDKE